MSQELYQLLHERARVDVMGWPVGLALSVALHGMVAAMILFTPKGAAPAESTKTTWVTLPALSGAGPAGGSTVMEQGKQGERQRRVEEVAPKTSEKPGTMTPNTFGAKPTPAAKGTNTDPASLGKAPVAAKGQNPTANPVPGAAGAGDGNSIGVGTGVPGLQATSGVSGGSGLIGDIDNSFPFVWYLQQVQSRITGNWNRMTSAQGRVQIYFRINQDGSLDAIRVEIPSGNAALDQSALLAVKRSNPLPRLPEGFEGQTLGVRFWFSYLGN